MRSKILAVAISSGAGVVAILAASLALALVAMLASPIVNLSGPWSTWVALFVGGGFAAYLLPSAWYLAAPLAGLGANGIIYGLISKFPAPPHMDGSVVAAASIDGAIWLQCALISALGGFLSATLLVRRPARV